MMRKTIAIKNVRRSISNRIVEEIETRPQATIGIRSPKFPRNVNLSPQRLKGNNTVHSLLRILSSLVLEEALHRSQFLTSNTMGFRRETQHWTTATPYPKGPRSLWWSPICSWISIWLSVWGRDVMRGLLGVFDVLHSRWGFMGTEKIVKYDRLCHRLCRMLFWSFPFDALFVLQLRSFACIS